MSAENESSSLPLITIFLIVIALICLILALLVRHKVIQVPASWQRSTTTSLESEKVVSLPDYVTPDEVVTDPERATVTATQLIEDPSTVNNTPAPVQVVTQTEKGGMPVATTPVPAEADTATVPLDGTLTLQGEIPQGAEIVLLIRPLGQTEYWQIQRFPAQAKISWLWPNAKPRQQYEVTFALQVDQETLRLAPVGAARAPATIGTRMNTGN